MHPPSQTARGALRGSFLPAGTASNLLEMPLARGAYGLPGLPLAEQGEASENCLHIGLINNMPDGVLLATERQFYTLLGLAAGEKTVRLSLFSLPGVPRSSRARHHIDSCYSNIDDLWDSRLDGIIVTGAQPVAENLCDEPYWRSLTKVADWAENSGISAVWSCLAAHAVVLHTDGIGRRRLSTKLSGVFDCAKVSDHPLTADMPARMRVPHSRWNELPEDAIDDCGYHILTRSERAGADTFVKQRKSLSVIFQGHPEYEAESLLLEYRRDIRLFLRGERDSYPAMPQGCFDEEAVAQLTALRERALSHPAEDLLARLSAVLQAGQVRNTWRPAAVALYRNWLKYLSTGKESHRRSAHRRKA